jgi:hypothetical protein
MIYKYFIINMLKNVEFLVGKSHTSHFGLSGPYVGY